MNLTNWAILAESLKNNHVPPHVVDCYLYRYICYPATPPKQEAL